jgi:2-amino-4-hydroxy-6-hydroxymethyldihydropteridine diphosphokinase
LTLPANGVISFISLGSNMGNPVERCREGIEQLKAVKGSQVLRRSSFYRTEPVGFLDQEWFINAVIEMRTSLPARALMQELQAIESRMGRQKPVKWGPRIIDLDILFFGQEVIQTDDLAVPHPELHKRRFVLAPLHEIAPYAIHPAFGVSVAGLMERLSDKSKVEKIPEEKMVI